MMTGGALLPEMWVEMPVSHQRFPCVADAESAGTEQQL
jgi:hypothetical protein